MPNSTFLSRLNMTFLASRFTIQATSIYRVSILFLVLRIHTWQAKAFHEESDLQQDMHRTVNHT